jgi:sigma-B regulation protein RsbU (phosphoserine phosphatase)
LTYPAGSKLPKEFDPIKREWYIGAKNSKRIYISSPYIDASTRSPMLTLSKAVFYPDGSLAGVTGIDFNLTDVFTWLRMNPKWASGAEAMLISREGEPNAETLKILARMNYGDITHQWDQPLELESLESPDVEEFAAFKTDMLTGLSGVRLLRYREKQSIWAYRGFKERQVYPLLIVPAENFKSIINETENFLWATNLGFLKYTALLIIIVIVCVIYVSIRRARSFTRPINDLAQAGNHLAEGNFDARVNIKTGDELQQLGEVFNQIGPKLREHQKMQHSLALARAV